MSGKERKPKRQKRSSGCTINNERAAKEKTVWYARKDSGKLDRMDWKRRKKNIRGMPRWAPLFFCSHTLSKTSGQFH